MIPTVIVAVLNRPDLLQRNIDSWEMPVKHLVIINNGQKLLDIESKANRTDIINSPTNLGVGPSWNLGIKMTPFSEGWLILNNDMWFPPGAMEKFWLNCSRDTLTLSNGQPKWCCAWLGDTIVEKHGLFSECYVPAYFEDVDYERRVGNRGGKIVYSDVVVEHDNASTANSNPVFVEEHQRTFPDNRALHFARWKEGVPTAGEWSLERRRRLGWDAFI